MTTLTATVDNSLLLEKLRIERSLALTHSTWRTSLVSVCLAVVFLAIGASIWFWFNSSPADQTSPSNTMETDAAIVTPTDSGVVSTPRTPNDVLVHSILDATGYVVARQAATVSSKTTGKVVAVLIEEGMAVQEGQIIARLDDGAVQVQLELAIAELNATKAATRELGAQIRSAQLDVQRGSALAQKQLISQSRLDTLSAELDTLLARSDTANQAIEVSERRVAVHRVALADLLIRAPFSGIVISKSAQPGEMISPVSAGGGFTRTGICTIVDMNSLEVEVDVNESYINRIHQDQKVNIKLNAYPERAYEGQVLAVIPTADRNKATIRVRVRFLATDQRVLPEMGVRVAFLEG